MVLRTFIFLLLNFAALAVGSLFTTQAVTGEWYTSLHKAPWTPPGWVFGAAWTTIMICFSFYMALWWTKVNNKVLGVGVYTLQWILNAGWNPLFFYLHMTVSALVIIILLTLLVTWLTYRYWKSLQWRSVLILPYVIWLFIATSLNAYIVFNN